MWPKGLTGAGAAAAELLNFQVSAGVVVTSSSTTKKNEQTNKK